MKTVRYEHTINVPADAAWQVFRDFGRFKEWNALPVPMAVEGDGLGMTRTMDIEGLGRIGERLDASDDATRTQAYSLVEGQPLGMIEYSARVQLCDDPAGCRIVWEGQFSGGADADEETMANNLEGSYAGMSQALEGFVQNH